MRVVLGLITKDEEYFLGKNMDKIAPCFDGIIAVDAYSTDNTVGLLLSHGAYVIRREWDNNYANARNRVIEEAEKQGYGWVFFLDTDESMWPYEIEEVKDLMDDTDFIILPRYEFVQDYEHYEPTLYPDHQGRVFRLNMGYHFQNKVHEMLYTPDGESAWHVGNRIKIEDCCHIYHYGKLKPKDFLFRKFHNYNLLMEGKPTIDSIQGLVDLDQCVFWKNCEPFPFEHPLKV